MARKLNVGCGRDIRPAAEGWVNMDLVALPGVDVVHSFTRFPWPLESGAFDHIYCSHVLEHVPHYLGDENPKDGFLQFLEECHRLLRPGGTVEIFSPHHESPDRWCDPTHTRVIHPKNFEYLDPDHGLGYYTSARFRVRTSEVSKRVVIAPKFLPMGPGRLGVFQHVADRLPFTRRLLVRLPWEIHVILEKV